jgi:two-component system, OmpR family, phosphate regulon response regulator PhoB
VSQLLLVEDDTSLGETLQERLIREGHSVEWAQNAEQARTIFESKTFDLAILDVGLPDGNGFELADWMKERSQVPFIFVTAMSSAEYRLQGFELGAEEYIPKPFHLKEILMRVRHVLENHSVKRVASLGELTIDFESQSISHPDGREIRLNARDAQILKVLTERSPAVVSRDEILNKFWGQDKYPSERTVDNCIVRLRQALADENGEIIRSVRGVGYQLEKRQHG